MPGGDEKQADIQYYVSAEVTGYSLILRTMLFYFQVYKLAIILCKGVFSYENQNKQYLDWDQMRSLIT